MPTETLPPAQAPADVKNDAAGTPAKNQAGPKSKPKTKPTRPASLPPYHVVLLDDNDHSHAYVVEMLKAIFGHPTPMGYVLADRVDTQGLAVVFTTHRELAELKRDQIIAYGNDWRVATCQGSMSAIITKADGPA